jgi:hypothetical protein
MGIILQLTAPGAPDRPMYATIISAPVTRTALTGTPERHCRSRFVINSGPVCPRKASVCRTLVAMYMELMPQVNAEKTKMALKKWAAFGIPASTAAMMKTERALTDDAWPLIKGWSAGTTNEAVRTAREYRVMTRRLIFRAAIFIVSTSARALLSAAVAATMSIPTYENITLVKVVLGTDKQASYELAVAASSFRGGRMVYQTPRSVPTEPVTTLWTWRFSSLAL